MICEKSRRVQRGLFQRISSGIVCIVFHLLGHVIERCRVRFLEGAGGGGGGGENCTVQGLPFLPTYSGVRCTRALCDGVARDGSRSFFKLSVEVHSSPDRHPPTVNFNIYSLKMSWSPT